MLTRRARAGGPQPKAAVESAVVAPTTVGAAPAAAASAPPPPPGVAIVPAGTLVAGSVTDVPAPVTAAAGVEAEADTAVAPVDSAPVDAAAGAAAAVTRVVVDTVAAAAAAAVGPPQPPSVVGPLARDHRRVSRISTDALARRRGRPGRRGARAYWERRRPAVTRCVGGDGPALMIGMDGKRSAHKFLLSSESSMGVCGASKPTPPVAGMRIFHALRNAPKR